jgi:hypothetical protein
MRWKESTFRIYQGTGNLTGFVGKVSEDYHIFLSVNISVL